MVNMTYPDDYYGGGGADDPNMILGQENAQAALDHYREEAVDYE